MRSSAQFNILALASGKADYNTQHSTLRIAHNSTLNNSTSAKPTIQNSKLKTQHSLYFLSSKLHLKS